MRKYRNIPVWVCLDCGAQLVFEKPAACHICSSDAIQKFDSKREAREYYNLKLLEKAGAISDIKLQPAFRIIINGVDVGSYYADFSYMEKGELHVIDVKSPATAKNALYRFKKRCVEAQYGVQIEEIK